MRNNRSSVGGKRAVDYTCLGTCSNDCTGNWKQDKWLTAYILECGYYQQPVFVQITFIVLTQTLFNLVSGLCATQNEDCGISQNVSLKTFNSWEWKIVYYLTTNASERQMLFISPNDLRCSSRWPWVGFCLPTSFPGHGNEVVRKHV